MDLKQKELDMGLDMYLTKKLYVQNWDHYEPQHRWQILIIKGGIPYNYGKLKPCYVEFQVGYWRKANQIHKWFVDTVQGGNDDQKNYWVAQEQLMDLQAKCKEVQLVAKLEEGEVTNGYTLEKDSEGELVEKPILQPGKFIVNAEEVAAILPTQGGFFFGSEDYDESYMADIERTIEITALALDDQVEGDIYYGSSW